jgi:DnaJ-class molecular chaperone
LECLTLASVQTSGDEEAAEKFTKINRAYEVLSDELKRQIYD